MSLRSNCLAVLSLAIVMGLVPGCTSKPESTLTPVKVNQAFENLLYIGLYTAKDGGFFQREGLDVTIDTGGGDAQSFAALTSGNAQFAQGDPAFIAIASEKGWEGRVVAAAVNRAAIWGVTFDKSIKPFSDPEGFRNRIVATFPEPNTSYVMQKDLDAKAHLVVGKDTSILQVPYGTELATLRNKRADIAQTLEPNVSQVQEQGGVVAFSYADAWGPILFTGVMTSKQLIDEQPDLVRRFVRAYDKALRYIYSNLDDTAALAEKRFPDIDKKVIRRALERCVQSGSVPPTAHIDPQSWEKVLAMRVAVGDLKKLPTQKLIDNQFADSITTETR
jgi:NitT/TauT family transport system substrate-binding protein